MNPQARQFFRHLHASSIRPQAESVAEALGLVRDQSTDVFRGNCRWDPRSILVLHATSGRWRVEPAGESGSLFELLARLWQVSPLQAGLRFASRNDPGGALNFEQRDPSFNPPSDLAFDHPALRARGVDPEEGRDREIGIVCDREHKHHGRLAVSVFDIAGKRVGRTYRRVEQEPARLAAGRSRPPSTWSLDRAFPGGRHLYNLDRAWPSLVESGAVVVVEGPFDALHLHRLGWTNAVALLGNRLTGWHVDLLLTVGVATLVFLLDNDHGGRLGHRWATSLDGRLDQFRVVNLSQALAPARDPDELTPDQLAAVLEPYRPVTWPADQP